MVSRKRRDDRMGLAGGRVDARCQGGTGLVTDDCGEVAARYRGVALCLLGRVAATSGSEMSWSMTLRIVGRSSPRLRRVRTPDI